MNASEHVPEPGSGGLRRVERRGAERKEMAGFAFHRHALVEGEQSHTLYGGLEGQNCTIFEGLAEHSRWKKDR